MAVIIGLLLVLIVSVGVLAAVALPHLRRGSRILTPDGERTVRHARQRSGTVAARLKRPVSGLPGRSQGRRGPRDRPPLRPPVRAKLSPTQRGPGPAVLRPAPSGPPAARHASQSARVVPVRHPRSSPAPAAELSSIQPGWLEQPEPDLAEAAGWPVEPEREPLPEPERAEQSEQAERSEQAEPFEHQAEPFEHSGSASLQRVASDEPQPAPDAAWPVVEPEPEPVQPVEPVEPVEEPGSPQQPIPGEEPSPGGPAPVPPTSDPGFRADPAAVLAGGATVGRQRPVPADSGPIPEVQDAGKPVAKPPIKPSSKRHQGKVKGKAKSTKGAPRPGRGATKGHASSRSTPPEVIDLRDPEHSTSRRS